MKTVTERSYIGLLCKFVERSQPTTEIGMSVDFCEPGNIYENENTVVVV